MTASTAGLAQRRDPRDAGIRLVLGLAVVFSVLAAAGWLVTGRLSHVWPLRSEDGVNRALALHRNHVLNGVSGFFSTLADTPSAILLSAVAFVTIRVLSHRWSEAVFVATALVCEVGVFLLTTLVIERPRPAVPHLDASAPPTSSFPSGHVAASVALYAAVALVAWRHGAPWPVWALLTVPCAVGFSRLYRGMHHPSDVAAGVLLGVLCVVLAHHVVLEACPARPGLMRRDRR
ncbi:phosphatase PAP2 family protein [Catenulispora subtropica]|uniref:Phosphatidic acid phosphatase type 2/haloperoxidase domain-containing protein n=1 Tax=Catenulispora subtropica TaxID=450798 RepID=A0ABN2SIL6_9ACTN